MGRLNLIVTVVFVFGMKVEAFNSYGHELITKKAVENESPNIKGWCNSKNAYPYPDPRNLCAIIIAGSRLADDDALRAEFETMVMEKLGSGIFHTHAQKTCKISFDMNQDSRMYNAEKLLEFALKANKAPKIDNKTLAMALGFGAHFIEDYFAHLNVSKNNLMGDNKAPLVGGHYMCKREDEDGHGISCLTPQAKSGWATAEERELKKLSADGKKLMRVHSDYRVDDYTWDNMVEDKAGNCYANAYNLAYWKRSPADESSWRYTAAKKVVRKFLEAFLARDSTIFTKALSRNTGSLKIMVFGTDVACLANSAEAYNPRCED
jgi:hypothetical protein